MFLTKEAVRFDLNSEGGIKREKRRGSKVKQIDFIIILKNSKYIKGGCF